MEKIKTAPNDPAHFLTFIFAAQTKEVTLAEQHNLVT